MRAPVLLCRYQLEALERAMSGNTVVFLDTGAGKTLIAGMLLRAYAHRVRKPARDFAVFLVPNRVLVEQQARVVEAHTDLRVSKFTGDMGVDFWNATTWRRVVDDAEVLVMTPQILLDNLLHSFFRLQDIALLIFDECHRAKGNYPYACILKHFEVLKANTNLYGSSLENAKGYPNYTRHSYIAQLIWEYGWRQRGDAKAHSKIEKFLGSGQIMREASLRLASSMCQPLQNTLCEEDHYHVESTGAIVTMNSSVKSIYFFCLKLPSDEYFQPLPRFSIDKAFGTCTLYLPKSSPVQTVNTEGEVSVLKKAVCLTACRELHAIGALTDYLLPELGFPCEEEPDIEPCTSYSVELPPELCRLVMSPVSTNTLFIFSIIPSVMYRIQCLLLSAKLKVQLGPRMQQFAIPALKVLEAVTTKECQEEFSQESLETLGDSFLNKRIADTVEALIGAYLSAAGEQAAFLFLKSLGLDIEFHSKILFERKIVINYEKFINVRSLEIILGYEFKDPSFLMEALTHGSYQIAGTTACYQVLGDAIESIAAAIYFDSKFDKEVVWRSMKRLLEPLATPDTVECDPVEELQEFCDGKSYSKSYTKTHKDGVSSVVAEV
ncbi:hypothetical protein ACQ4PT_001980 [Festuca glaucescens]